MDRYILASNSPRRRELLRLVISDYEVIPSEGEEIISSTKPDKVVEELSLQKAMDVAGKALVCIAWQATAWSTKSMGACTKTTVWIVTVSMI